MSDQFPIAPGKLTGAPDDLWTVKVTVADREVVLLENAAVRIAGQHATVRCYGPKNRRTPSGLAVFLFDLMAEGISDVAVDQGQVSFEGFAYRLGYFTPDQLDDPATYLDHAPDRFGLSNGRLVKVSVEARMRGARRA